MQNRLVIPIRRIRGKTWVDGLPRNNIETDLEFGPEVVDPRPLPLEGYLEAKPLLVFLCKFDDAAFEDDDSVRLSGGLVFKIKQEVALQNEPTLLELKCETHLRVQIILIQVIILSPKRTTDFTNYSTSMLCSYQLCGFCSVKT